MTDVTLRLLADEIQTSVDLLVQQFANAGIKKSANDLVTIQEKQTLLAYLNRERGLVSDKFTLQCKTHSTLNIPGIDGKNKPVKIEVRKLRTFIKRDHQESEHSYINEEQIKYIVKEQACHEEKLRDKCKIIEKNKQGTVKKNKTCNYQDNVSIKAISEKIIDQEKKINKESEIIRLIRKTEKKAYRIDEKNKRINNIEITKDNIYGHTIGSQCIYQTKNKDGYEIENNYGHNHNTKMSRLTKKKSKDLALKFKREELNITTYTKDSKHKNSNILQQGFQKPTQAVSRSVIIAETITVGELANKMAVKSSQVIKIMMQLGAMATINQVIDQETAQLVAEEMGHKVILCREDRLEEEIMNDRDIHFTAEPRAPIVTIMGHVDHGKTSLLDYIRSTRVASNEIGGITQHIGAYHVKTENGTITFLDTPGHAAFTAMRARGIQITDIVILVVAADDGIMPQTIEAIQHIKAARASIIVAINKIDKPEADPNRVKNELVKYDIVPEEWGGDCQFIHVSAKFGTGISELLNAVLIQAEILELKAVHKGMAKGIVIESFLDKNRGPVATILVREGTLHKGDIILCGFEYGRVRSMRNDLNYEIAEAGPSIPVEIIGLSGVPITGDKVTVVRDEKKAREVALYRQGKFREIKLSRQHKIKLENMLSNMTQNKVKEINIVLKADTQGSVEAISDSLLKLSTDNIKIKIIGSGVGNITDTDAMLAVASKAILIGFNVSANISAVRIVEIENLNLLYYSIIYNLVDAVKEMMRGMLSPKIKQQVVGLAEVRDIFKSPKFGTVAGCVITEGVIKRHNLIRILRNNIVIYEGELGSLRHFKDDVNVVRNGMECGIGIKNYDDIHIGDIIEVLETIKVSS